MEVSRKGVPQIDIYIYTYIYIWKLILIKRMIWGYRHDWKTKRLTGGIHRIPQLRVGKLQDIHNLHRYGRYSPKGQI